MTPEKRLEIKQLFLDNIELNPKDVMEQYIFWPLGTNEHYLVDEIVAIKAEAFAELNPAPVVEEDLPPNEE